MVISEIDLRYGYHQKCVKDVDILGHSRTPQGENPRLAMSTLGVKVPYWLICVHFQRKGAGPMPLYANLGLSPFLWMQKHPASALELSRIVFACRSPPSHFTNAIVTCTTRPAYRGDQLSSSQTNFQCWHVEFGHPYPIRPCMARASYLWPNLTRVTLARSVNWQPSPVRLSAPKSTINIIIIQLTQLLINYIYFLPMIGFDVSNAITNLLS